MVAPAGTPKEIVNTLNAALVRAIENPELKSRIEAMGGILAPGTPEQLKAFIAAEIPRWAKLVKDSNIKL